MKLFTLFLLLAAFIQTSFLPINLCLIFLMARTFVINEHANFYLGFCIGLFLSVLTSQNLGFWSVVFLAVVEILQIIKRLPILTNIFSLSIAAILLIVLVALIEAGYERQSFNLIKPLIEVILLVPVFLIVQFWEERFVVKPGIKLRIKS